jgi:RecA-family ATPase
MSTAGAHGPEEDHYAIRELMSRGKRFVVWKLEVVNGVEKKVPYSTQGHRASVTNPEHWDTLEACVRACGRMGGSGIGFVFTGDGIAGLDLDGCRDPETGAIAPWAQRIIDDFASYTEVSPSGTGVKIYFLINRDTLIRSRKQTIAETGAGGKKAAIELYTTDRYFTVTNKPIPGVPTHLADGSEAARKLAAWVDGMARAKVGTDAEEPKERGPKKETAYTFVNDEGLKNLPPWVLELYPEAEEQGSTGGYRVSSAALGRDLEEDLGITPQGIVDWGMHDHPEETRGGKRTPIGLVIEHGGAPNARAAAEWLAERLGVLDEFQARLGGQDDAADDFDAFFPGGADGAETGNPGTEKPGAKDQKSKLLPFLLASTLLALPKPIREWEIQDWMPRLDMTLLFGAGGVGKTTLLYQLAAAIILRRKWLGLDFGETFEPGPVLFLAGEDKMVDCQIALHNLAESLGVGPEALADLRILPGASSDFTMIRKEVGKPARKTELYERLYESVRTIRPRIFILDPLVKVFSGEWAGQEGPYSFVNPCRAICEQFNCSGIAAGHPSQSGIASGTGTYGGVGWENAVRARWYLRRPENKDGETLFNDRRLLTKKKNNMGGGVGDDVEIEWRAGVFHALTVADHKAADVALDDLVFAAIVQLHGRGVRLNPSPYSRENYVIKRLAEAESLLHFDHSQLEKSIRRLLAAELLEEKIVDNNGKSTRWLVPTDLF